MLTPTLLLSPAWVPVMVESFPMMAKTFSKGCLLFVFVFTQNIFPSIKGSVVLCHNIWGRKYNYLLWLVILKIATTIEKVGCKINYYVNCIFPLLYKYSEPTYLFVVIVFKWLNVFRVFSNVERHEVWRSAFGNTRDACHCDIPGFGVATDLLLHLPLHPNPQSSGRIDVPLDKKS